MLTPFFFEVSFEINSFKSRKYPQNRQQHGTRISLISICEREVWKHEQLGFRHVLGKFWKDSKTFLFRSMSFIIGKPFLPHVYQKVMSPLMH
jgi:hypothetical protein